MKKLSLLKLDDLQVNFFIKPEKNPIKICKKPQDWQEISQILSFYSAFKCKFVCESMKRSCTQSQNWSIEEDNLLRFLMNSPEYGTNSKYKWTKIAQTLNETLKKQTDLRLAKHCRERFFNHLKPNLRKGDWTVEEDVQLLKNFLVFHKKWSQINAKLVGRNDNIVKNRFYKLMKENKLMSKSRKKFNDENIAELIRRLEGNLQEKQQEIFNLVDKGKKEENMKKIKKTEKNLLFENKSNDFGYEFVENQSNKNENLDNINEINNANLMNNNYNSNYFYFINENVNANSKNEHTNENINARNINENIFLNNNTNNNENLQNNQQLHSAPSNFFQNNNYNNVFFYLNKEKTYFY